MSVDEYIQEQVRKEVDRALEEKIPEIVRALGIREAEPQQPGYVDAIEIAKMLGKDVSTPENTRKAKKHVYNLAAQKLIPSVRLGGRTIKFDKAKVKEALDSRQIQAA